MAESTVTVMIVVALLLAASVGGNVALLIDRRRLRKRPYTLAFAVHDRVLQSIVSAQMSFEVDDEQTGFESLKEAMNSSKELIAETVAEAGGIVPGSLSKMRAARAASV